MLHLLDLPDEVLCKIFEYLSAFDAISSFLDLNRRFNRLLHPFKQQIDLTHLSYGQVCYYLDALLPVISQTERLYVLKIGNRRTPGQIELFNRLITNNDGHYFRHIDRVLVDSPRLEEFINFVDQYLASLPNLTALSIKIESLRDPDFRKWTNVVLTSILPIPSLVKLSVTIPAGLGLSRLPDGQMFHSLRDLTLNVSTVTDLLILVQRTPNLESLSVRISWWTSGDRTLVKILDEMRSGPLRQLKRFSLTIDSIMTFQYEHLEQVLQRTMNRQTTSSFAFSLRNCVKSNGGSTAPLLDGRQWEKLLSPYSSLNQFDLFMRISDSSSMEEESFQADSFLTNYFLERKWCFSFLKYCRRNYSILYSTPYRKTELFDLSLDQADKYQHFPVNYTPYLVIDPSDAKTDPLDPALFRFVVNQFPCLEQLCLSDVKLNSLNIKPAHYSIVTHIENRKEHRQ